MEKKLKPQLKIYLKSISKKSLILFTKFFEKNLKKLIINYSLFTLPLKKKRITLLKSPHVNKKAKEQFEIKKYKKIFYLKNLNKNQNKFLKYLLINKPKSVEIKIKL